MVRVIRFGYADYYDESTASLRRALLEDVAFYREPCASSAIVNGGWVAALGRIKIALSEAAKADH